MKNFKVIVSLVALIAVSNACAISPTLKKRISAVMAKIEKNPSIQLDQADKDLLNRHINDTKDAWVKETMDRLRRTEGFDMDQLQATSSQEVATQVEQEEAPVQTAAAKKLTPAQQRAAARREATAAKTTQTRATTTAATRRPQTRVTTAAARKPQTRVTTTPTKPLTAAQRRAAAAAKREAEAQQLAQTQEPRGSYPTTGLTLNMSYAYDDETGLFTEDGVAQIVENVREKYPSLNKVRLIAAAHDEAVEYLKPLRRGIKSETLAPSESNELMTMINKVVLEPETKSASAPDYTAKLLKEKQAKLEKEMEIARLKSSVEEQLKQQAMAAAQALGSFVEDSFNDADFVFNDDRTAIQQAWVTKAVSLHKDLGLMSNEVETKIKNLVADLAKKHGGSYNMSALNNMIRNPK